MVAALMAVMSYCQQFSHFSHHADGLSVVAESEADVVPGRVEAALVDCVVADELHIPFRILKHGIAIARNGDYDIHAVNEDFVGLLDLSHAGLVGGDTGGGVCFGGRVSLNHISVCFNSV